MRRPSASFWRGKRVLVTGHTGFKGSWASIWLAALGARVTGLALAPDQKPALFNDARVGDVIDSHIIDLRKEEAVDRLVRSSQFDLVLHLAAQPIVRTSIEDPIGTFASNVMGSAHLLQALRRQANLAAVLVVTSDKVYANHEEGRAFRETDALGGKDPYSSSKAAAEIVTQSFAKTYFDTMSIPVATARGGNVIGGGDFSRDRLVADIVRAARRRSQTVLRHPEATRPWQHVLDCIAGYLVYLEGLMIDPTIPRSLNFGPKLGGAEVTVGELATRATKALGSEGWRYEPDPNSIEAQALGIDASLARQVLSFESRLDAAAAVEWTVEWYRKQAEGGDARDLVCNQISRYESL